MRGISASILYSACFGVKWDCIRTTLVMRWDQLIFSSGNFGGVLNRASVRWRR